MEFRISDTFTDSFTRLTGDDKKSVKTTAFDLQINPVNPGIQFSHINCRKDPNFWSVRAGRDIRVIVHKTDGSMPLCNVDHHDATYAWAERRRINRHPRTGAAPLVEVREIEIPKYVEQEVPVTPKSLGVDIRERSQTLKIIYRTSHQIRSKAGCLLGRSLSCVEGNAENHVGTISVFDGAKPSVKICDSLEDECSAVAACIADRETEGVAAAELCIIVRGVEQVERATAAIANAGSEAIVLDSQTEPDPNKASITTMYKAKGLEFRAVILMACDDAVQPLQSRIEPATDTSELEDVYNTERHLLYVACTRARDHLLITAVDPASEFLDNFEGAAIA